MKINLTKKQYESLAKTVYLGNWMANAHRDGTTEDPRLQEYEDITDYVFSLAPEFGLSKNYEHALEFDEGGVGTEINHLHEAYDESIFWEELSEQLGTRDFFRKYSDEERKNMNSEDHFLKLQECIIAWEEECESHGIERLEIMKQAKDFGIDV